MTHLPASFVQLPLPLPPMLLEMAEVRSEAQFVGLYYWGTKATWSDGCGSGTFSYFSCWAPFSRHPALAFPLAAQPYRIHLGSDDLEPSHQIICDRQKETLYVAPWQEAQNFLKSQHPPKRPPTPEEWAAVEALIEAMPRPSL